MGCCFSTYLGIQTSLLAEMYVTVSAIQFTIEKGWTMLWLEYDSQIVVSAFSNPTLVPWKIKSNWTNCLNAIKKMKFVVSHVFREGNTCADNLASFGVSSLCNTWWKSPPDFILRDFNQNRFGCISYRFR